MKWRGQRQATGQIVEPQAPGGGVDLGRLEHLGEELVGTMQSLHELLSARARDVEEWRSRLDADRRALTAEQEQFRDRQRELVEREDRCERQLRQVQERARELLAWEQALDARQKSAESTGDPGQGSGQVLDERARELDEESRRIDAARAEIDAAREALTAREAALARSEEAASAKFAGLESELRSRLDEAARARESVAVLQAQIEADARNERRPQPEQVSGGQGEPAPAAIPAEGVDSVGRIQKLSRDARRRATGG